MLSEIEKQEMLADARSKVRRDNFRQVKASQENSVLSAEDYLAFCQAMLELFPVRERRPGLQGTDFRL